MVRKIVRTAIRLFNLLIPKDKKRIFLRSSCPFRDNITAILDCMIENGLHNKYKIYCNGAGFEKYEDIKEISINKKSDLRSFYIFLRSKYVILNNGLFLNSKPVKNQTIVNVWHGVSFKKIGFYQETEKPYRTATNVVTYSDIFAEKMAFAFGVPLSDVLKTGEPRNDYLFEPADDELLESIGISRKNQEKIIFWMPTYRQSKFGDSNDGKEYEFGIPFLNSENIKELDRCCSENGVILVIKWHSLQKLPSENCEKLNNIVFLTSEQVAESMAPLYSILARADALITDYSSVYINYMLLDRPICFAYDDLEYYTGKRGFMFDNIEELMPGFKTDNIDGLYSFVRDVKEGNDAFKDERKRLEKVLNDHSDNMNCIRLIKEIGIL